MASRFCRLFNGDVGLIKLPFVRYSARNLKGKPPEIARNLEQRMAEMNYKDPKVYYKVDIGLPVKKKSRKDDVSRKLKDIKKLRNDSELEKLARENKLIVPLDVVYEEWKKTNGPSQIKEIADHYNIFSDLFGDAYFTPHVVMEISYKHEDKYLPVFRGNDIKPFEATKAPVVQYEAEPETLWTLVLTNPDGHLTLENGEYVHWFIGNILESDLQKGEVIYDYLQPFPPYGTGFHRFVFVLYKQNKKIDFSKLKKPSPCLNLSDRTFSTYDFYRAHQDFLTPAGLSFFQSDWDKTLTDFYHNVLDMKEPVFEYDFPEPYVCEQEWFPLRKAFNVYLDKYRDPKQIAKEFLLKKLKITHPFKKPPQKLPFPNAVSLKGYPSWLRVELEKERLGFGRVRYHDNDDNDR